MKYVIYFQNSDNIEVQQIRESDGSLDNAIIFVKYPPRVLTKDYIVNAEIVEYGAADAKAYKKVSTFTSTQTPVYVQYNASAEIEWYIDVAKTKQLKDAVLYTAFTKNAVLLVTGQHYIHIEAYDYYGAGGEGLASRGRF